MKIKNLYLYDIIKIFILLLCCYSVINFLFLPHNHLISYPVYIDDYNAFTYTFDSITWHTPRPVIYFLAPFFAQLGIADYYILLLFCIILCATLVYSFAQSFFSLSPPKKWIIFYGGILFSYPFIIEVSKNLCLIVNLCSAIFALISLLSLLKGYRENKILFFILSAIFYTLSLFTKEDFILPGMILIFYLLIFEQAGKECDRSKIKLIGFSVYTVIAITVLFLFNKYVVHSDFTGMNKIPNYAYQLNINFFSMLDMLKEYLTSNSYQLLMLITMFLIAVCSLFLLESAEKIKIFFLIILIISLVIPYTVLPHHFEYYYTYNWVPSEAVLIIFGLFLLTREINQKYISFILGVISIMLILMSYVHRSDDSVQFEKSAKINKNIMSTLKYYKAELNQQAYIGVMGVKNIQDLAYRLHVSQWYASIILESMPTKWIVFEKKKVSKVTKSKFDTYIQIVDIQKICNFPHMKYLYFDQEGKGKLIYNCHDTKSFVSTQD